MEKLNKRIITTTYLCAIFVFIQTYINWQHQKKINEQTEVINELIHLQYDMSEVLLSQQKLLMKYKE